MYNAGMKTSIQLTRVWAILSLFCAVDVTAQSERLSPFEIGIQLTGVHLHKIHETPYGLGARLLIHLTEHFSFDSEVVHYPENTSGNFGETTVLFGVKDGWRSDRLGVFGKARAGLMHFGGAYFDVRLERKTFFTIDLGGVLEYYPSPRTAFRIDLGDTIVFYGSQALIRGPGSPPLGTVHNFQPALGFSFRF
jgi:hypothetical protein